MSKITVQVSNRIRLAAAVLAASDWPPLEGSQAEGWNAHPQADATRQYLLNHTDHPAVQWINALLPSGLDLAHLFSTAVRCLWPTLEPQEALPGLFADGIWASDLGDFYVDTAVAAFFWSEQEEAWSQARSDLQVVFHDNALLTLMESLSSKEWQRALTIAPNLTYPAQRTVVASNASTCFIIAPPPANGKNHLRSYRDGADRVLADACFALAPYCLDSIFEQLSPAKALLLRHAVTALFLEQASGEAAAMFYRAGQKREPGLSQIDVAVEALHVFQSQPEVQPLVPLFAGIEL